MKTNSLLKRILSTLGCCITLWFMFSTGFLLTGCKQAETNTTPELATTLPNGLTFLVLGDWGFRGQLHQQPVADQMEQYAKLIKPKFVVSTGDNFYLNGVNGLQDEQWQQSFERIYTGADLQIPFKVILGNHDYEQTGSAEIEIAYTKQSSRWQMPAHYFTESVAVNGKTSLRLVYIDTNPFIAEYRQNSSAYPGLVQQDRQRQLVWIDSVLSHSCETWKIVVGHHPIQSVGTDHGGQPEMVAQLQPLLTNYGVQMYLCGHTHTLQHLTTGGVTDYIISGAGGAPLGDVASAPPARFAVAEGGFTILSVNTDSLRVSFVNASGTKLYQMQRGR